MELPGLDCTSVEEGASEGLTVDGFNNITYVIPEKLLYGTCRRLSDFQKVNVIKEDESGGLYEVIDRTNNEVFMLKKIKVNLESEGTWFTSLQQIRMLKRLKHDNILYLHNRVAGMKIENIYMSMTVCKYQLSSLLVEGKRQFKTCLAKNILRQLTSGVHYLHELLIIHRNIRPSKILFTENGCLKISGCENAVNFNSSGMKTTVGHLPYKAPELLLGSKNYTYVVDMWSVGCVMTEILGGKMLFPADCETEILKMFINCLGTPTEEIWPGCLSYPLIRDYAATIIQPFHNLNEHVPEVSLDFVNVLKHLVMYNPQERYTALKVLEHEIIKEPLTCSNAQLAKHLMHLSSPIPPENHLAMQDPRLQETVNSSLQPGSVNSSLQPGSVNSSLQPGLVDSSLQPGLVDSSLQPGSVYRSLQSGSLISSLQPGSLISSLLPSSVNSSLLPSSVNSSLQPHASSNEPVEGEVKFLVSQVLLEMKRLQQLGLQQGDPLLNTGQKPML